MDLDDETRRERALQGILTGDGPWRAMHERSRCAESILDMDGVQRWSNQAFRDLFGTTTVGLVPGDITAADDQGMTARYLEMHRRGELDRFIVAKRYRSADGTVFGAMLESELMCDADGIPFAILGRIIPDELWGANTFDLSRYKFERVLDAQSELICEWTADSVIVWANRTYMTFFGYATSVVGMNLLDLVPTENRHEQQATLDLVRRGGLSRTTLRSYESGRTVEWVDTAIRDHEGDILSVISVGRDVTEKQAAQDELDERREAEVIAARRQQSFVATVSHELRNPLHGITGITELLAERLDGTDEGAMAAALHTQSLTLQRIVNDLLDLSRVEQVGLQLRPTSFDLHSLVRSVTAMASTGVRRDTVDVRVEIDPTTPVLVMGDRDHLGQILHNVIGNAVKYTTDGHVSVGVAGAPDGTITVTVGDSGIGIDHETMDRIFEAFVRGDKAAVTHRGAGLGLAIVQLLVTNMGGTIDVSSEVGHGSVFTIRLPLPASAEAPPSGPRPGSPPPSGTMRVLIVDDDVVNQMVAEAQCARLGMTTRTASSGEQALELLATERFDAMLLDVQLSGMSGLAVAGALRRDPERPFIIGMTASASAADQLACLEAGMDHFVAKPAGLQDVSEALARATATPPATDPAIDPAAE
jgi:PAS domain S-box-containing protein